MKKWFALLTCALMLASSCTALALEVDSDVIRIGMGSHTGYSDIVPLDNGNMIVSLGTRAPLGSETLYPNNVGKTQLLCVNTAGDVLWHVELGEETGTTVFSFLHVLEDGTLMGLVDYSANQYPIYEQWRRYNAQTGELLWQGEKVDTTNMDISTLSHVSGSNVVTMEFRYLGNEETRMRIWLVGDDGNPVWTLKPEDGVNYLYDACGVEGATLLYCRYSDKQKHADAMYTALMLIQNDGSTVWSRVYEDYPIGQHCKIIEANEQTATLITRKTYFSEGGSTLFTIDMKTGDVRNSVEVEGFSDVLQTSQGILMLCRDADETYHCALYDEQGSELKRWDAPQPINNMRVPWLFEWAGRFWANGLVGDDSEQREEFVPIDIP